MALWRDPLDELIEELERARPSSTNPLSPLGPPLEDLQWSADLVLNARTDEERAAAEQVVKEVMRPGYRSRFHST
jgi:hypothetical protein